MEVHHHPQLKHEPKPWKEYLLEGLMIFVAVTMGFFAESLREHITDSEKSKQYAQSLYDDLKVDTMAINRTSKEKQWIVAKFDSAQTILHTNAIAQNNEFLYYVERYLIIHDVFSIQDVTYQQLRNSGNFRFIRDVSLYKNLADYYNLYSRYQAIDGAFGSNKKDELEAIESKLFDPNDLASLDSQKGDTFYDLVLRAKTPLKPISGSKEDMNILFIKIHNTRQRDAAAIMFLGWLKNAAVGLMTELKKEYDLRE
jgi:hypothetical protein